MTKISVIVPNYNHAAFLNQRLASIFNQSYQDFEVILLDDCSTDNSNDIIEQFRNNPKISHIVNNQINSKSTFRQWDKGIRLAKGDYIWIAESDDFAQLNFLERLIGMMDKNPHVGLAHTSYYRVNENDEILYSSKKVASKFFQSDHIVDGRKMLMDFLVFANVIENASGVVFRREVLSVIEFDKFSKFKYCGDWMFWVQILFHSSVYFCSEELNNFRIHPGNVSNSSENKGLFFTEGLEVVDYIRRRISLDKKRKWKIRKFWAKLWINRTLPGEKRVHLKYQTKVLFSILKFDWLIFFLGMGYFLKKIVFKLVRL